MRERLIELLLDYTDNALNTSDDKHFTHSTTIGEVADYLLKNGVIVPPCKVGDYVEWDNGISTTLKEVKEFYYDPFNLGLRFILDDFAPVVNHSSIKRIIPKEEAEKHLKGGVQE